MTRRVLPCANIDPETGIAFPASWKPSAGRDAMFAAWDRYRTSIAALAPEAASLFHPLVDLSPSSVEGPSRRLVMAADGVSMAKLVESMGFQVQRDHALLVMTPAYAVHEASDVEVKEQSAIDLGYFIERLYPIAASGPIEPMIPWLARLVGSILVHGSPEPGQSRAFAASMMSKHFALAVHEAFGTGAARAEFLTAYPSWPYMAEPMARMAIQGATMGGKGCSLDAIAIQTRGIMGAALGDLGLAQVAEAA